MSWFSRLFGTTDYDSKAVSEPDGLYGCCDEKCRENEVCFVSVDLENEQEAHKLSKVELEKLTTNNKTLVDENVKLKEELRKAQESAMKAELEKHQKDQELESVRRKYFDELTRYSKPTPCAVPRR